jgi:hypothetical protein
MAAFDLATNAAPLLKRYYDDRRVYSMAFKNRPAYAWIPKKTGVVGEASGYNVPVTIDDIAGESGDFSSAVTARSGDKHEVWQLGRIKRYATATLDWETVRAMKNDTGAFMRAVTPRINSGINQLANSVSIGLFGDADADGHGWRGTYASDASEVITLQNPGDARKFGIGRKVVAVDSTDSSGAAGTAGTVTAVDIAAGTITMTAGDVAAMEAHITAFAAGDFLYLLGDTVATNPRVLDGFNVWGPDPATITVSNPFRNVDRAVFKSKLLMLHADVALQSTKGDGSFVRGIREACATLQANEGSPDVLFVHPDRWAQIESDLASQSRYEMMMGSDGRTGFDSIVINAGGGKVNIVADPWCGANKGYLLQQNTWEMFSIDRFPDFVSDDGNRLHRLENADQVEFRLGGYFNVACRAPGHNMVINFLTS